MEKLTENTKAQFIGEVVDLFENYLADQEIDLKSEERDEAIEEGEVDADEAAILYGEYYDVIGDTVAAVIIEHNLMEKPFADAAVQQRQVEMIMDAFYEVLDVAEFDEGIPSADVALLKSEIGEAFEKWNLSA